MKNSQFTSRLAGLGNNRGQALIEYTLMVIISVALVMAISQVFVKPMGEWVSNYLGKYTSCLLEYGELPSLGSGTDTELSEDTECDKRFYPGTITAGRPPIPRDKTETASKEGSTSKTTAVKKEESSGGSNAGSASRGGSRNISNRRSFGTETGPQKGGKTVEIALDNGGGGGFFGGGSNYGPYGNRKRKSMSVGLTGLTESQRKKLERTADGGVTIIPNGANIIQAKKKMTVKPPPERTPAQEDEPLTFGNFIRYLFIAALVIALVIFVGGQALQMSKSGEK